MAAAFAQGALGRHDGAARAYTKFSTERGRLCEGLTLFPTEGGLVIYAAYLACAGAGRGLRPGTIRQHLSGNLILE